MCPALPEPRSSTPGAGPAGSRRAPLVAVVVFAVIDQRPPELESQNVARKARLKGWFPLQVSGLQVLEDGALRPDESRAGHVEDHVHEHAAARYGGRARQRLAQELHRSRPQEDATSLTLTDTQNRRIRFLPLQTMCRSGSKKANDTHCSSLGGGQIQPVGE